MDESRGDQFVKDFQATKMSVVSEYQKKKKKNETTLRQLLILSSHMF